MFFKRQGYSLSSLNLLIGVSYDHDPSIPREIINKEIDEVLAEEKKKKETIHQQILDNHMRFEALEDEDLKKFNSRKNNA